jgi:MFS family permease
VAQRFPEPPASPLARLPFYYGWVVVTVAFVTMAIGVNTRTAFSLLYPPILAEFGWARGETAAAISHGFLVSAGISPLLGLAMDRFGPRWVIPTGALIVSAGLALATLTTRPWHLYLTLGVLVVGGSVIFAYVGHSMFLPLWFVKRRGLAIGIAFSGVGAGSVALFPWLQTIIGSHGWRQACWALVVLLLAVLVPLNTVLQRRRPQDLGLLPDGDGRATPAGAAAAESGWSVRRAVRSAPFWWIFLGYFSGLFAWYAVQVHQTRFLLDIGVGATEAAFALGLVPLAGVLGQIGIGHMSDRVGREWAWTVAGLGFALCYVLLLLLYVYPSALLLYPMVFAQGALGYGMASVYGAIPAEIFAGRAFGAIFGLISLGATVGAGAGPWVAGAIQDRTGSYAPAFVLGGALALLSILCIWLAAPRKGFRRA